MVVKDPICFAEVNEDEARREGLFSAYNQQSYYFCSRACKDRFDRDPGAFMHAPAWEVEEEKTDNYIG